MLVLSRRIGETIRIGEDIAVKVLHSNRRGVRLAIEAPAEVAVHSKEFRRQIAGGWSAAEPKE